MAAVCSQSIDLAQAVDWIVHSVDAAVNGNVLCKIDLIFTHSILFSALGFLR